MKPELQIKFLHYLNQRKQEEEGFTLIELLVVIIIIGILAAIALPSLLGQANKAKQSEARNNVGAISRAQQAYSLEASVFSTSMIDLGIGIQTQSVNYRYPITGSTGLDIVFNWGAPIKQSLKAYVSITATGFADPNDPREVTTVSATCESLSPSVDATTAVTDSTGMSAPTTGGNAAAICTNTQLGKYPKTGTTAGDWKALGS
ncbi:MAG: type IV pilin-like G/H family protein [Cyanobacteria bacterium SBLK]|nr:type IV pilin-like G/H family protein [Cyanobacteria bacterium SBLK]